MKSMLSRKQYNLYFGIGTILLFLFVLLLMSERWTVFLPYSKTWVIRFWVYLAFLFGFLLLYIKRITDGLRTTLRGYVFLVLGALLGSWAFEQASYGFISISNSFFHGDENLLCLRIVENLAAPEGIVSRTHTIKIYAGANSDFKVIPIRYRYPEIGFRNLKSGDVVEVTAIQGWAGYTLKKVVPNNSCASLK